MSRRSLLTLTAGFLAATTLAIQPVRASTGLLQENQPFRRTISVVVNIPNNQQGL
jgi:hypothetical protein